MLTTYIHYGLLIALAIALLFAAATDIKRRQIDNWLNIAIAVAAPAFWWASGMSFWPDVAIQIGLALGVFAVMVGLFALGAMGGGDVKLLTAVALWVDPSSFLQLLMIMALVGGALSIFLGIYHIMKRRKDRLHIPYGVAISIGGLFVLYPRLFDVPISA